MTEIKPCPFCDNRMVIYMDDSDDGSRTYYGICNICDMRTEDFKKEQELLEYLNTRPIEDALNQRIKELETELAKVISKNETLNCYMCYGSNYLEWVDWDTFDDEHKQKYLQKARSK